MKKVYGFLAVFVLVCALAYAGNKNDLAYYGFNELDTTSSLSVSDEVVVFQSDVPTQGTTVSALLALANANTETSYEVGVTNDTLTVAESGKIFVCTANCTKVLPTATNGVVYTVADGAGVTINVDPASTTDTIEYLTLDGGDKISSSGATGDTVTLLGDGDNSKWYVIGMGSNAWTDGGA